MTKLTSNISLPNAARGTTVTAPMRNYFVGKIEETGIFSNRYTERPTSVTLGWRKRSSAHFSLALRREFHTSVNHLNVDVITVAMVASSIVFLVCLFALLIWAISGFVMIHPFIALITMIGCIGFYLMGMRAKLSHFGQ